jgi:large conductance mechanosensitive channel
LISIGDGCRFIADGCSDADRLPNPSWTAIDPKEELSMDPSGKLNNINPLRHATTLFEEFKKFAFKGNVVDLAIGVIIGGAFGKIVDSLVKNVIMPLISTITPGEKGYESWGTTIRGVEIPYGQFLAEVVNFLIVALALFIFIKKFLGWVMKEKQREVKVEEPKLTKEQELLMEIRDLMKRP